MPTPAASGASIRLRWALFVIFIAALAGTYMLFQRIPSTFLPVEDQGYFFVVLQLPDGASLERTEAVAKKSEEILRSLPGVTSVGSVVGFSFLSFANQSNAGVQFVILKPWDERGPDESATALREKAQQQLFGIPDALVLAFDPPSIQGLGATGGFEFQVEDLTGRGAVALDQATQALFAEARKQPEINPYTLFTTFSTSTPQFQYDLDRNKAKLLGLNLPDIFNTLQIYLGSLYVNDFNLFGRTFRVTLQADPKARASATDISRLYVRNAAGEMVPLNTLGSLRADRRAGDRHPLQQLPLGADQRRGRARLQLEPGDRGDGARRRDGPAEGLHLRMDRHHLSGDQGGLDRAARLRPCHRLLLPDPRRPVRELVDALHGSARGAARATRRARRPMVPRHADSTSTRRSAS